MTGQLAPINGIEIYYEIHGEGGRETDWTNGCIALANRDMDDLLRLVGVETPVTIIGSDEPGPLSALAQSGGATPEADRRAVREKLLELALEQDDIAQCDAAAVAGAQLLDQLEADDASRSAG